MYLNIRLLKINPLGYDAVSFGLSSPRRVLTMKIETVNSSETSPTVYHIT